MNDAADPLVDSVQLDVNQHVERLEVFTGLEQANGYSVSDSRHGVILFGTERSSRLARYFLGKRRPFTLWLVKPDRSFYLRIEAPYRLLFRELSVFTTDGEQVGRVTRDFSFFHPHFTIYDAHGIAILEIRRNLIEIWTFRICRHGREVGLIRKLPGGASREYFTDADGFRLNFASVMRLPHKQLLLAALFLIDMDFFENNQPGGIEITTGS